MLAPVPHVLMLLCRFLCLHLDTWTAATRHGKEKKPISVRVCSEKVVSVHKVLSTSSYTPQSTKPRMRDGWCFKRVGRLEPRNEVIVLFGVLSPHLLSTIYSHSSFSTITIVVIVLGLSACCVFAGRLYSYTFIQCSVLLVAKPLIVLPRYIMTDGGEFRVTLKKLWSKWSSTLNFR